MLWPRTPRTVRHCNTLQHTVTHCNALQHTATHCNTLQHTATHCNTHCVLHCVVSSYISHTSLASARASAQIYYVCITFSLLWMIFSSEKATSPKSTKSRNSDSLMQILSLPLPGGTHKYTTHAQIYYTRITFGVLWYGVAMVSRLLRNAGLFCRI